MSKSKSKSHGLSELFAPVGNSRPHGPRYASSSHERYLPSRAFTAEEQAAAVRLFELEHKRVNEGLSEQEMVQLTLAQQRERGLWIGRKDRHRADPQFDGWKQWCRPEERRDERAGKVRAAGVAGSVTVREYLRDWRLKGAALRPGAEIDASVSVPKRIQRGYEEGRFFPHAQVPEVIMHDAQHEHPYLFEQDVVGCSYAEKWGKDSNVEDRKTARPEVKGRGTFGWSWRQRRSFVRKLALIRIMFLFLRSEMIRGGGDDQPLVTAPHMSYLYSNYVKATDENLNFGPWASVEDMLRAVVSRNLQYWKGMDAYALNAERVRDNKGRSIRALLNRPALPNGLTALANVRSNFHRAYTRRPKLDAIRGNERELYADNKRFVLYLWNDIRSCLMMKDTRIVGLDNFQKSMYAPYSVAIADLTNQYKPDAKNVYYDKDDLKKNAPFKIPERYLYPVRRGTKREPHYKDRIDKRGRMEYGMFAFHVRKLQEVHDEEYGEITMEDLQYGDRYDDVESEHDRPPQVLKDPSARNKMWADEGLRDEAEDWFLRPVLLLVNQFVETYLAEDKTVKWLEPEVAQHLLYPTDVPTEQDIIDNVPPSWKVPDQYWV